MENTHLQSLQMRAKAILELKGRKTEKTPQVVIYEPGNCPEIDREPGDERVLFFIPDNGRNLLSK